MEMAIDYKKEWEKLMSTHGQCYIQVKTGSPKSTTMLGSLMVAQIKRTIGKRESLMKEYLANGMKTDITGGDALCHYVGIGFHKKVYGNIAVSKADFDAWCKKKGGRK